MLVKQGMAVVYPQYLNRCMASKNLYLQAEQEAKHEGFGVWTRRTAEGDAVGMPSAAVSRTTQSRSPTAAIAEEQGLLLRCTHA